MRWASAFFVGMVVLCGLLLTRVLGAGPGICLTFSLACIGWLVFLLLRLAHQLTQDQNSFVPKSLQEEERRELQREYNLLRRTLKELELDHNMHKLSEEDYKQSRQRYRERAIRILQTLEDGPEVRGKIEADFDRYRNMHAQKTGEST